MSDIATLLSELNDASGLELTMDTPADAEAADRAGEALAALLEYYKGRNDRSEFCRALLLGSIDEDRIAIRAMRAHLDPKALRVVFLFACPKGSVPEIKTLLHHLVYGGGTDILSELSDERIAVVHQLRQGENGETCREYACTLVSSIQTELMLPASVGCSLKGRTLSELNVSLKEASFSLDVGRVFGKDSCFAYSELGLGKLVFELPEESCRLYIKEVTGSDDAFEFDPVSLEIVEAFFENNLNISETARRLYLHRNTLVYRLEKLRHDTGLDLRIFDDAVKCKLLMLISERLKAEESGRS